MEPLKIAVLGPSDIEMFEAFGIMDRVALSTEIAEACRTLRECTNPPILVIVPYKGLPVEVARSYRAIGGEVHGLWDESLSESKNFAKNKAVCTSLFKCPYDISIQRFLVNCGNILLVMGISNGTLKELLENNVIKKPVFLHPKFVSVLPIELQACFEIQIFHDWITFAQGILSLHIGKEAFDRRS